MTRDVALIQSIYDTALRPQGVPDVLQRLSDEVGAYGAMVFDCQTRGNLRQVGLQYLSASWEPDRDGVMSYLEHFNAEEISDQDLLADLSSSGNEVNLIHDKAMFRGAREPGPNVAAMLGFQISDRYGALLSKEAWNLDRFAFQYLAGSPLPDRERLLWAEGMLSHLAKAMSIGRTMSRRHMVDVALSAFLDSLPIGLAVVGARGEIFFSNEELRRIAQDNPDVRISADKRFSFSGRVAAAELGSLMADDTAHGRFGARPRREAVFIEGQEEGSGLFVEICPIEDHPEMQRFGPGARLVSILDSKLSHRINPAIIAQFFPLSKSEMEVLDLLGEGHSNTEIADIRGRSVETVNSQIKSLLRKTNSRNRTELVKTATSLSVSSSLKT